MEARTRQKLRWNMKDYLKLRKEELKKRGAKGFTLMEMLIIVAIIAVLIAIAIPIFTSQLENSREATDAANLRSAYATASAAMLTNGARGDVSAGPVAMTQVTEGWQNTSLHGQTIGTAVIETDVPSQGDLFVTVSTEGTVTIGTTEADTNVNPVSGEITE